MKRTGFSGNDKYSDIFKYTFSLLIFGSIGIFRRYIPLPSACLATFRGFAGALVLLIVSLIGGKKLFRGITKKQLILLILSGASIGINWVFLFEAFNYTSVTIATLCCYMQPTIVILVSPSLFGEKLNFRKTLCVLFSLIGMVMISGAVEGEVPTGDNLKGILCGLGCAFFFALVVILSKKVPDVDTPSKTVLQLFIAGLTVLPYALLTGVKPTGTFGVTEIICLLIVGFVHTGFAYLMYFGGMDGLKAQTVAYLSYIDPIFSIVLSAIILKERLTLVGAVGALLIIGSAWVSEALPEKPINISSNEVEK